jgi:hypothetical protein
MNISRAGVTGTIKYSLFDKNNNLKAQGINHNLVVNEGLYYLADKQLSSPAQDAMKQMVLGTGTATPGSADTWVSGPFPGNGTALGTAGSVSPGTIAGTLNAFRYIGTFGAGYATQNGINEAVVANSSPGTAGTEPTGQILAHALLSPGTINKGASDTLVITWDFVFNAA